MAYTPDAKTQAALAKSRSGAKLTSTDQALLTKHSQRMVEDMSPRTITGGGSGPYDYGSGTTGGYGSYGQNQPYASNDPNGMGQMNPNSLAETYQNFINSEQERRQQGLPPRPLPAQFAQLASQNNPLGYNLGDQGSYYKPTANSQGMANLQAAGHVDAAGLVRSQPVTSGPYGYPNGPTPTPSPQPNPGVNPTPVAGSTPTPVQTNPTATMPFNPADALPSAPMTVHTPNGGLELGNTPAGIDEGKLLAEAELQKQLRTQTYDQQVSGRQAMLDELSQTLQKQQAGMMADKMPGIYEDLNTRGLLRSSGLGEQVNTQAASLARQTSEQLALQGITDRNTAINDLGGIEDSYLSGRGSALQRRFSLEDFDKQLAAGKSLGANALPQISQPSGKGAGALQGGLGGATVGGTVGGAPGAIVGGVAGLLGGGQLGGKK